MEDPSSPTPDRPQLAMDLAVLSRLYQSRLQQAAADYGLTYTQLALLNHLAAAPEPQSITDLTHALQINQPGVTKVVRRLAVLGFVESTASTTDLRKKYLSLTERGHRRLTAAMGAMERRLEDWFPDWPQRQNDEFAARLAELVETLGLSERD